MASLGDAAPRAIGQGAGTPAGSDFVLHPPLLHAFLDSFALEDEEGRRADEYAVRAQGTSRHLNAAKRKLKGYFRA